jgi:hypothetical protein
MLAAHGVRPRAGIMAATPQSPFRSDALDANRRGELSDEQLRGYRALSWSKRRSSLSTAAYLVAGALLVAFFASPSSSVVLRGSVIVICLTIAAFLVVRAISGADALTRDLRHRHVESIEGAVGKRRRSAGRTASNYYLDVGDRTFTVGGSTYAAAPDAGFARVYFLPRSRKIVNIELTPKATPALEAVPLQKIAASLGAAFRSQTRRERNEARAEIASIGDALESNFVRSAAPPSAADSRALGEAIVGSWKNAVMKLTFSTDGQLLIHMGGTERRGHWSVDGRRLSADIMGHQQTADAWVAGNQLTITLDGDGMAFTRESGV